MDSPVLLTVADKIALLEFNRPHAKNALRPSDREELRLQFTDLAKRADVRAVVLTGNGSTFCAGADLKAAEQFTASHPRNTTWSLLHDVQPALESIVRMDKPVIAAINGPAIGIGVSLALAADLAVMDQNAFMLMPFMDLGLVPDGGAVWFLLRRVGYSRMFQILCDAEKLTAEACLEIGLVNRIVEPGKTLEATMEWAKKLAEKPPTAMALTKRLARMAVSNRLEESLSLEAEFQSICGASADSREAIAAFREKRPPKFD